jgi:hypothetical protein
LRILAAIGHKTMKVFKRYNPVNIDKKRLLIEAQRKKIEKSEPDE